MGRFRGEGAGGGGTGLGRRFRGGGVGVLGSGAGVWGLPRWRCRGAGVMGVEMYAVIKMCINLLAEGGDLMTLFYVNSPLSTIISPLSIN